MDFKILISKIAADKDSKKLGKILRIDSLLSKTLKQNKPFAMILVEYRFKSPIVVPLDVEKLLKFEGQYVWFDILKSEFDEEVKHLRKIKNQREIYTGHITEQSNKNRFWTGVDYTNLSHKRKERR